MSKEFVGFHVDEKVRPINTRGVEKVETSAPPIVDTILHEEQNEICHRRNESTRAKHRRYPQDHYERSSLRLLVMMSILHRVQYLIQMTRHGLHSRETSIVRVGHQTASSRWNCAQNRFFRRIQRRVEFFPLISKSEFNKKI